MPGFIGLPELLLLGLVVLLVLGPKRPPEMGRSMERGLRFGFVAMAALAVALPGVDPVTTALEMLPLFVLYEGSIWLAVVFERRWTTALPRFPASTGSA